MASQRTFVTLFTLLSTIYKKYQQLGIFGQGTFWVQIVQKKVPHYQSGTYFLGIENVYQIDNVVPFFVLFVPKKYLGQIYPIVGTFYK